MTSYCILSDVSESIGIIITADSNQIGRLLKSDEFQNYKYFPNMFETRRKSSKILPF
jgi:hypothetical protein